MKLIYRPLWASFAFFVCMLLAAFLLLEPVSNLTTTQRLSFIPLPYYLLGFVCSLSLMLNRSRISGLAACLLIIYFCIQTELQLPLGEVRPGSIYFLLCVMIPVAFALLALMPEQRSREFWGVAMLILAPILAIIGTRILDAYLSMEYDRLAIGGDAIDPTNSGLSQIWLPRADTPLILPYEAYFLFALCLVLSGLAFLWRRTVSSLTLVFCLLFSFITLNLLYLPMISTLMVSAAGLTLFAALIISILGMLYKDELTGIANRKALNRALLTVDEGDILVMADIDRFKKLNDTYGHDTGDEVLKLVSNHLTKAGERSQVFRYGGEEFSYIFNKPDNEKVIDELNRIRQSIAGYDFVIRSPKGREKSRLKNTLGFKSRATKTRDHPDVDPNSVKDRTAINASISMGAVVLQKGELPEEALVRADEQLYKAKKGGRNKVCVDLKGANAVHD